MRIERTIAVMAFSMCMVSCSTVPQSSQYEYKVMSLYDMFGQTHKEKLSQLTVSTADFKRTDMDVPDYQEALDRLSSQGWELVTVNKSNYWVFRRLKK